MEWASIVMGAHWWYTVCTLLCTKGYPTALFPSCLSLHPHGTTHIKLSSIAHHLWLSRRSARQSGRSCFCCFAPWQWWFPGRDPIPCYCCTCEWTEYSGSSNPLMQPRCHHHPWLLMIISFCPNTNAKGSTGWISDPSGKLCLYQNICMSHTLWLTDLHCFIHSIKEGMYW